MLEVGFRFRHGCPVNRLSERYPDVRLAHWCNFRMEVLEVHAPAALVEAMQEALAAMGRPGEVVSPPQGNNPGLLVLRCTCKRSQSVDEVIGDHGCLYVPPVIYHGGWEHYRILAFAERDVPALFKDLGRRGEVELLTKRRVEGHPLGKAFMVSTMELLAGLTPLQAHALARALEHGYYRVPRRVRSEDIAKRLGVPRTTFEEHMRKAESKVLHAMAPYVALYAGAKAPGPARPTVRPRSRARRRP